MDQPYSVWADMLAKFHTSPEGIQALWLVCVPVTVLGFTGLIMRGLTALIRVLSQILSQILSGRIERGHLIYGIYQDPQGRWMVYRHGRGVREVDGTSPPEPIGRGEAVSGAFRGPEI